MEYDSFPTARLFSASRSFNFFDLDSADDIVPLTHLEIAAGLGPVRSYLTSWSVTGGLVLDEGPASELIEALFGILVLEGDVVGNIGPVAFGTAGFTGLPRLNASIQVSYNYPIPLGIGAGLPALYFQVYSQGLPFSGYFNVTATGVVVPANLAYGSEIVNTKNYFVP